MKPGEILDIKTPIRAYDEFQASYWADGPILILESNEYDVTFLCMSKVLYSSFQEIAVELELNVS